MSPDDSEGERSQDERIFAVSEDLVQSPAHKAAGTANLDFDGVLQPSLKLHEDLAGGCGGQLWLAGMVLAKYLLRKKRDELGRAKSIVELGAGGGLVGLAVALGCDLDGQLHITDQEPMLGLMRQNIVLNSLQAKVKACVYDWGNTRPDAIAALPDVILAADCVYFEPAFPLLQQTLQELMGPQTVCYFCFKKRRRADLQFVKAAKRTFDVREVADDADGKVYARENIHLLTIRQKAQR